MYTAVLFYSCSYISDLFVTVFHWKIHIIWQKATNTVLSLFKVMI